MNEGICISSEINNKESIDNRGCEQSYERIVLHPRQSVKSRTHSITFNDANKDNDDSSIIFENDQITAGNDSPSRINENSSSPTCNENHDSLGSIENTNTAYASTMTNNESCNENNRDAYVGINISTQDKTLYEHACNKHNASEHAYSKHRTLSCNIIKEYGHIESDKFAHTYEICSSNSKLLPSDDATFSIGPSYSSAVSETTDAKELMNTSEYSEIAEDELYNAIAIADEEPRLGENFGGILEYSEINTAEEYNEICLSNNSANDYIRVSKSSVSYFD